MGKHLDMKELKQKEAQVNQILNKTDDGNKYKLNIVEKKSGDVQHISFLMTMNGKQVGSIKFEGTPETNISDYSNIHTYFTPEGKSNEIIYKILTPALLKGLTERAE
jgi:hypothetical protein